MELQKALVIKMSLDSSMDKFGVMLWEQELAWAEPAEDGVHWAIPQMFPLYDFFAWRVGRWGKRVVYWNIICRTNYSVDKIYIIV